MVYFFPAPGLPTNTCKHLIKSCFQSTFLIPASLHSFYIPILTRYKAILHVDLGLHRIFFISSSSLVSSEFLISFNYKVLVTLPVTVGKYQALTNHLTASSSNESISLSLIYILSQYGLSGLVTKVRKCTILFGLRPVFYSGSNLASC